ncbi:glycosyltransferase [Brevibacillus migulae]|uniref:glycosyltransferase n=1 Tax=Brevibacillus migulae TaxID=1644114 RepID=UPI00106DF644|nr:glycosyltransferase [Brevibacillus migulae]
MKVKVLTVHNRYLIRGGEDESVDSHQRLLKENGHYTELFEESNERVAELGSARTALRTIWSVESSRKIRDKISAGQFDILDCQNTFPLISPSVYYAAKKTGIPVIQTLRNYRLLCPNALFFRNGKVCEDCLGQSFPISGVINRCYRDSFPASATVSSMIATHRLLKTWNKQVDLFVTLTHFARHKFIEAGFPEDRIVVKPNFVFPDPGLGKGNGDYALFVGRLTEEKGIHTVLAAWQKAQHKLPLKIIGEGPLADQVAQAARSSALIEYIGKKPVSEVYELMGNAKFLLFPSEWYETFGRVAIEAFAKGTPVIAANIGAIAEIVDHGRTGLHFIPGDADDLAAKIDWAQTHPDELKHMRAQARSEYEQKYTAQRNYQMLMEVYEKAQILATRKTYR